MPFGEFAVHHTGLHKFCLVSRLLPLPLLPSIISSLIAQTFSKHSSRVNAPVTFEVINIGLLDPVDFPRASLTVFKSSKYNLISIL